MLIFIDESGDAGFKLTKGSTPHFVVAMTCFHDNHHAEECGRRIDEARAKCNKTKEFHFNNCSHPHRDIFFGALSGIKFDVRAIVVDKTVIHSDYLKCNHRQFNNYVVKMLLTHNPDVLEGASVKIDGSGNRLFKRELASYLRKYAPEVKKVAFADSKRNNLIQLADMVVGAIARARRADRNNPSRWRDVIARRIGDEWLFK